MAHEAFFNPIVERQNENQCNKCDFSDKAEEGYNYIL